MGRTTDVMPRAPSIVRTAVWHSSPARHDRGAPTVIRNRHVFVVQEQRVIGAKDSSDVGGVVDRGIKIRVVANRHRKEQFGLIHRHEKIRIAGSPLRIEILIGRPEAAPSRPLRGPSTGSAPARTRLAGARPQCPRAIRARDNVRDRGPDLQWPPRFARFLGCGVGETPPNGRFGWENPFRSNWPTLPNFAILDCGCHQSHAWVCLLHQSQSLEIFDRLRKRTGSKRPEKTATRVRRSAVEASGPARRGRRR